jgi:hypothetical protein
MQLLFPLNHTLLISNLLQRLSVFLCPTHITTVPTDHECINQQAPFGNGVLHLIQINRQPDATIFQFIILMFVYSSTCFGRFPAHRQELNDCCGSLWFYLRIVVIVVLYSWSDWPATNTALHIHIHTHTHTHTQAATAVIELLMMRGKTPETS